MAEYQMTENLQVHESRGRREPGGTSGGALLRTTEKTICYLLECVSSSATQTHDGLHAVESRSAQRLNVAAGRRFHTGGSWGETNVVTDIQIMTLLWFHACICKWDIILNMCSF